MIIFNM